jgi:hypothetical protein
VRTCGLPAPGLPLGEQLAVHAARLVRVEAVLERVLHVVHAEEARAAVVGAVQKRTVVLTV